jgi:hypothetical protein
MTSADFGCFLAYLWQHDREQSSSSSYRLPWRNLNEEVASFVASGGVSGCFGICPGKLVNGFVCEAIGNQRASFWYMIGLSLCTRCFASGQLTYAYAGMEFFSSLQWTALSVLMMKRYANDPGGYIKGIATMSIASTGGQFLTKTCSSRTIAVLSLDHDRVGRIRHCPRCSIDRTILPTRNSTLDPRLSIPKNDSCDEGDCFDSGVLVGGDGTFREHARTWQ